MIFKNLNMPPGGDNTPAQIPFGIHTTESMQII